MPTSLRDRFDAAGLADGGEGRFGLWTRSGGAILTRPTATPSSRSCPRAARPSAASTSCCSAWPSSGCSGSRPDDVAAGAVAYTKSAADAIDAWTARSDGADAAFLLEPTPVASIVAVARDGDVMPQKSTYFYPKALTGLVINPHEW